MLVKPTALASWTEEVTHLAADLSAMSPPSVPMRLTLVPPPPPRWTRRLVRRVHRESAAWLAAVVPSRAEVSAGLDDVARRLTVPGGERGDLTVDVAEALHLAASHLRGEYAADRRGHVVFLVTGTVVVVAPLDLVPGAITRRAYRLMPLVGFLAESIRGDIDLFRDWLRWDDAQSALPMTLTEAFEAWAAAESAQTAEPERTAEPTPVR